MFIIPYLTFHDMVIIRRNCYDLMINTASYGHKWNVTTFAGAFSLGNLTQRRVPRKINDVHLHPCCILCSKETSPRPRINNCVTVSAVRHKCFLQRISCLSTPHGTCLQFFVRYSVIISILIVNRKWKVKRSRKHFHFEKPNHPSNCDTTYMSRFFYCMMAKMKVKNNVRETLP